LIYSEEFEGFETLFRLFPPDPVQKKPVKISGNPVWVFLLQTGGFRKRESNFSERRVLWRFPGLCLSLFSICWV